MQTDFGLSARRADRALSLSRSARDYRPRIRDDGPLIEVMQVHLRDNPGYGGHHFAAVCDRQQPVHRRSPVIGLPC